MLNQPTAKISVARSSITNAGQGDKKSGTGTSKSGYEGAVNPLK